MRRLRGAVIAFIASAFGCLDPLYEVPYDEESSRDWPVDEVQEIRAETPNGAIRFDARAGAEVTVNTLRRVYGTSAAEAKPHADEIEVEQSAQDGLLHAWATIPEGSSRDHVCSFTIEAPPELPVSAQTDAGQVTLEGMIAGATLVTDDGDIEVRRAGGALVLDTDHGSIAIEDHQGSVRARAARGPITCGLRRVEPASEIDLRSESGDVVLTIPADASVAFELTADRGRVTVENLDAASLTTDRDDHKAGHLGSAAATILAHATHGDVILRGRE